MAAPTRKRKRNSSSGKKSPSSEASVTNKGSKGQGSTDADATDLQTIAKKPLAELISASQLQTKLMFLSNSLMLIPDDEVPCFF